MIRLAQDAQEQEKESDKYSPQMSAWLTSILNPLWSPADSPGQGWALLTSLFSLFLSCPCFYLPSRQLHKAMLISPSVIKCLK